MSRKLIVGNWKMNGSFTANRELVSGLQAGWTDSAAPVEVAVAPPAVYLAQVRELLGDVAPIALAAQDVSVAANGAYTGDISAAMLQESGVRYVIVGHSERRKYQAESNAVVAAKALAALNAGLIPIVCVGETLDERDAGSALAVVSAQLQAVLDVCKNHAQPIVVAYEPVWAIGTGRTATPAQAQEVHAALRQLLARNVADALKVSILYGGSMNAVNAAELLAQPDIDGGLIGGAALKAVDFLAIVGAARELAGQ